jgi:hypothetical protein
MTGMMGSPMSTARLLLIAVLGTAGCNGPAKNDNPVLGPPPQRVSLKDPAGSPLEQLSYVTDTTDPTVRGSSPTVVQAGGAAADGDAGDALFGARVVATVNGAPIFASDILSRYGPYLKEVQKRAPEQFDMVREQIIRGNLKHHIERVLLAEMMRNTLKPDQLKQIEQQLDVAFESEIKRLRLELKVNTTPEL